MLLRFSAAFLLVAAALLSESHAADSSLNDPSRSSRHIAERPYARFCTARDLVGTWRVIKWTSELQFKDPNAPYLLPYQLFQFSKDGAMKSVHSKREFTGDPMKTFQAMPAVGIYRFNPDRLLTIKAKGNPRTAETWHCSAVIEDRSDDKRQIFLKKGDVVMTLIGKNGRPLYVRQMRK